MYIFILSGMNHLFVLSIVQWSITGGNSFSATARTKRGQINNGGLPRNYDSILDMYVQVPVYVCLIRNGF